jgi:DNA polymerase-3 subunit gamma/tau
LSVLDQLMSGSGDEGLTYQGAAALLGFTEGEMLDATIDGLAAGDAGAVFRQIDKVIETGHDPRRFVEDLLERLRDLIVVAAVPDGASSILRGTPEDQLERIRQQSAVFGPGALSRAADIVNAGLTEMTGATAPRLQLELICARVLLPGASGESGYAARLDRLERRLEMNGAPPPTGSGAATSGRAPAASSERQSSQPALSTPPVQREPPPGRSPVSNVGPPEPRPTPKTGQHGEAPVPGAIDTDAIRRSWPDILAKIFTIRRTTWTFLSEHTQVLDYDGTRLLLGIQTEGLATTFRRGQHAELVRQALSEVLGVEAVVEGIPTTAQSARSAPPQAPASSPAEAVPSSRPPVDPSPPSATPPASAHRGSAAPAAAPVRPFTPRQRARAVVAHEASTRNTSASSSVADDSMVSADDEDIEEAVAAGQPVIARVLGGTVIGELDQ